MATVDEIAEGNLLAFAKEEALNEVVRLLAPTLTHSMGMLGTQREAEFRKALVELIDLHVRAHLKDAG